MPRFFTYSVFCSIIFFLAACEKEVDQQEPPRFELLTHERTNLNFENALVQSEAFNVFYYMYYFNGGGVAAGDFNQDGKIDLYFTANMGSNKCFLNRGNFEFEDITETAGLAGLSGWTTGASVVDINNDGLLDIYVSQVGDYLEVKGKNQLYVNLGIENGIPRFEDQAADYGLDLIGFGTQATFFDYDLDGDLDLFQLNHSLHQNGTFGRRESLGGKRHPLAGDRLLRNDNGTFVEVSTTTGIMGSAIGYGLGVVVGDVNRDGWPDLYIGNDFHENDYLYLNQKDGTFREALTEQMPYTSRFSMGVDLGDINNDGWLDIMSLDMLPEDPYILKSSLGEDGYDVFQFKLGHGYHPQFSRNTLQLNNANGTFSDIGMFAGVFASDWSWGPLFFDQDNDGNKDIFVTNGIPRRMNDIDYVNFKTNDNLKYKEQFNDIQADDLSYIDKMPEIKLPNKFYQNNGNLTFKDASKQIDKVQPSYSNSGIYADLDGDGDLDLVVNNIDDEPFVYRNLNQESSAAPGHYFSLQLKGEDQNINAIGSKILAFKGDLQFVAEHYPTRGYQSSSLGPLHLGVGEHTVFDSLILIWPDRSYQLLDPATMMDKTQQVTWQKDLPVWDFAPASKSLAQTKSWQDVTDKVKVNFAHQENPFVDFNREALIPRKISAAGPAVAVGDVNGDGREDFFVGSSKRRRSALYLQNTKGQFDLATPEAIVVDSVFEDVDAVFTDLENDGDLDLVIAAGGNEYRFKQAPRLQRAYLNDGKGNFTRADVFPEAFMTASCVAAGDVNGDGLTDIFFGGRVVPWAYGRTPESYLYLNQGDGNFKVASSDIAANLSKAGMVTDAEWSDYDQDGDLDLILALEWESITIFENQDGALREKKISNQKGWWNTIKVADYDQDGDLDIIAGNLGANTKLKPTPEQPLRMYVNDFDDNEQVESVLTYYVQDREIPFASYAELTKQLVSLKKRYLYASDLAAASVNEIFGKEKLKDAQTYKANYFLSTVYQNDGTGNFTSQPLPDRAQLAPVVAISNTPVAGELTHFLLGGNSRESNIEMGWYEASYGQTLSVDKTGQMKVTALAGLSIPGEIRSIAPLRIGDRTVFLVVRNNDTLMVIEK